MKHTVIKDLGRVDRGTYKIHLVIIECIVCKKELQLSASRARTSTGKCKDCSNQDRGRIKHGKVGTKTYNTWKSMKSRCKPGSKHSSAPAYAGKGIAVCKEWENFESFCTWAGGELEIPNSSIERIDSLGHYEPANCIIMPEGLQRLSQSRAMGMKRAWEIANLYLNDRVSIADIARKLEHKYSSVYSFIHLGNPEDVLKVAEKYPTIFKPRENLCGH